VFASRHYNAIRCHSRDLALGERTHAQESLRACVVRALRGVGGVGTHAAQHWVQHEVSAAACGWKVQANRISVARLITVK